MSQTQQTTQLARLPAQRSWLIHHSSILIYVFLCACLALIVSGCAAQSLPASPSALDGERQTMAGPPSIELVAAQNGAGRLAVRGSNWAPGEAVLIALEEDGETGNVLAAGIADANGEFTVGLEIRQQLLDSEGEPKVLAFTDSQDTRAQALLNQPLLSALASASDSADENVPSTGAAGIGQRRTITNTGLGSRFGQNNETTADETTDGTAEPEGRLAQLRNRLTATSTVTISGTPVSRVGAAGGAGPIAVNAYAEVTPESGGAGTQVTVTGGGFPANTTVNVHLAGLVQASDGSGSQPHIYASTTTNNNGAYSITFAMPSQWPSGSPLRDGTITVLIATDDFSVQASDVFEFTSDDTAPTAVPTTGPTATWTSAPTTAPTNAPTAAPTAGRTATANISPEMGGAGTLVTVRGTGFPANTRVNVHMAGLVQAQDGSDSPQPYTYASTITDAGGSYRVSFNMPANWPRGAAIRTGTLTVLVATSDFSIQATDTFEYTAAPPTATPIPTATNTPTPLPTNTPTATPTNTPTNTPLPTATPTNTPTPVPTNTPTATSTPAGQPFVNLEPSAGSPGTLIAITGGGFPANTRVNVYLGTFDEQIGTGDEIIYATAVTTADGAFSTAITLPSAWPDGSVIGSGPIVVLAATDGFAQQASAVLTFNANATPVPAAQAYLTLNPAAGGPGTLVTITGGGFLPNTVVNVYLGAFDEQIGSGDVVSYASAYTDGNGNYGTSIVMPSTWPDGSLVPDGLVLVMVATESFEQRATATFSYTRSTGQPGGQPFAQAQPERGGAGTVVTVSGGNFPPNTTVNLQIAGLVSSQSSESSAQPSVYATTTTGNNGSYVLTFTMPATFASGTPIRSGPLALLVATNDFSTQASAVFEFEGTVSVTPTPAMGILFDDDPRNNQRDVNAYFCSGFESECNFAGCAAGYRLVWGPYCRANDYPYIGTGRYRVTIYGTGNVRVGATDYGTTNDLFAYGDYEINLPGSYTFCWQGREPGGYGFETIVQSLGGYADVQRMVIEYLGPEC